MSEYIFSETYVLKISVSLYVFLRSMNFIEAFERIIRKLKVDRVHPPSSQDVLVFKARTRSRPINSNPDWVSIGLQSLHVDRERSNSPLLSSRNLDKRGSRQLVFSSRVKRYLRLLSFPDWPFVWIMSVVFWFFVVLIHLLIVFNLHTSRS